MLAPCGLSHVHGLELQPPKHVLGALKFEAFIFGTD